MVELWLAPYVVARRLPQLALEAQRLALGQPAAAGRAEGERMVTEKVAALRQGLVAMAFEGARTGLAMGMALAIGNTPAAATAAAQAPARLARAAMKPAQRRVKANAKRLSRG